LPRSGGNSASFALNAAQTCAITVTFTPQESGPLTAALTVNGSVSADNDTAFTVPITGTGVGADAAQGLGFGAQGRSELGLPQLSPLNSHGGDWIGTVPSSNNRISQDEEHHAEIE
jgi:hypothetical protein